MEHVWSHGRCLNCNIDQVQAGQWPICNAQSSLHMQAEQGYGLAAQERPETQDARIFMVNGLSVGLQAPVGIDYDRWLVSIVAAGYVAITDALIPWHAIALVAKGELLKSLQAHMTLSVVKGPMQ